MTRFNITMTNWRWAYLWRPLRLAPDSTLRFLILDCHKILRRRVHQSEPKLIPIHYHRMHHLSSLETMLEHWRLSLQQGIGNHLIITRPDATASAIDNADASASGLRSVKVNMKMITIKKCQKKRKKMTKIHKYDALDSTVVSYWFRNLLNEYFITFPMNNVCDSFWWNRCKCMWSHTWWFPILVTWMSIWWRN